MKILVYARHPGGGIRTYFRYVYGQPVMQDVSFSFLTPEAEAMEPIVSGLPNTNEAIWASDSTSSLFIDLLKLLRSKRPDIIHSHGFTAAILAALPAWLLRIPHVATTHDVFLEGQFGGIKGRLTHWLIGRILGLATVINPVGEDARSNFIRSYPSLNRGNKVHAIRNGIDSQAFLTEEKRDLRSEISLEAGTVLLGFFGRFMAQKGFRYLVEAVKKFRDNEPNKNIQVACFGWGGFIREEQQALLDQKLDHLFHFFPATNEMGAALRGVDIAVLPSRWEACPLLPMEAMVAGVPLLTSDCIGMQEVTEDTPAITFPSEDSGALFDAIKTMVSDLPNRQCIAENFRSKAAERFDAELTAQKLRGLYQEICHQ